MSNLAYNSLQIKEKIVTVTKIIEYAAHIYGEKAFSVHM